MRLGFFRNRPLLDAEDEAWHLDTWLWLLTHLGGIEKLRARYLVRPTREFFPPTSALGHERARHVFELVKTLAGMADWPCNLEPQPERPNARVAEVGALVSDKGHLPLGTYGVNGNAVLITYDPALVDDPAALVAVFAHELSHYLIATVPGEMPGGDDMHEYATDLGVAFLGFGLFAANRAVTFSQHRDVFSQGWRMSRQGYLRERDWSFALAVFSILRSDPPAELKKLLKKHLYSDFCVARRYLEQNPKLLEGHIRT